MSIAKVPPKRRKSFWLSLLKWSTIALIAGIFSGVAAGAVIIWQGAQFDDLNVLKDHEPKLFTKIYDRNGRLISYFSSEKRIVLDFKDIPDHYVNALVALEDEYFWEHIGVSPLGIISALKDYALTGRVRGASTLTQQLVKNITKDARHSVARKLKEQLLAVQVEAIFTKKEILAMYANEVPFGNQQFGIEAAARYYFGKSVSSLNLVECATLAGIPSAPSRLNPYRNLEACKVKRNYTLSRMVVEGYITQEEYETAKKLPLEVIDRQKSNGDMVAGHFLDMVREYLFEKYGEEVVRTSGWQVYTTLDLDYQLVAEDAVKRGLERVDKRQGYRSEDVRSVFWEGSDNAQELLETYTDPSWHQTLQDGILIRGVIMSVDKQQAMVRIGHSRFTINASNLAWVGPSRTNLVGLFKEGDVPLFRVEAIKPNQDEEQALEGQSTQEDLDDGAQNQDSSVENSTEAEDLSLRFRLELEQEPVIQGSFLALDTTSGDILAMVGGYSYDDSKFNRAIQATRQVGSAFKPMIYGAALEQGFDLNDLLFDEPTQFIDPTQFTIEENGELSYRKQSRAVERMRRLGLLPLPEPYEPQNYYRDFSGMVTLRQALAESKNIVAVKVLNSIGYDHAIQYAYRMGLGHNRMEPYPSLALGSMEMPLVDLVQAYATYAMQGVRFERRAVVRILDKDGRLIEENHPRGQQVISPENAYMMTSALTSVINDQRGTARSAQKLGLPLGGKTGTTDDYNDAWFLGFHPQVVAGVWVGHDKKKKLWDRATGSNTALPIWIDFFDRIKDELDPNATFEMPMTLKLEPVDKFTGKRLTQDCDCNRESQILEVFSKNSPPVEICELEEQKKVRLPWYLQKRVLDYDEQKSEIRPAREMIDYNSQLRAKAFLESQEATSGESGI